MNNTSTVTLRLSRSAYVETNINVALIRLDEHKHLVGQPVMVRYYAEDGITIDTITAIGIKNGVGKDCYSILSTSGEFVVNGVHRELPDVSSLVNGGRYISYYNGQWCIVYIVGGEIRRIDPDIPSSIIKDAETGFRWFFVDGILKREDDFLTPQQVSDYVRSSIYSVSAPIISVALFNSSNILEKGTTITSPSFSFSVIDFLGTDLTRDCRVSVQSDLHGVETINSIHDGILTLNGVFTETIKFTFTVKYDRHTFTKEYQLIFTPQTFYDTVESLDLSNPIRNYMLWGGTEDLEFDLSLDDEIFVLLVPSQFPRFTKIYDKHGLDYIDDYDIQTGVVYRNESYTLYTKKDPVKIDNFKQVFTR